MLSNLPSRSPGFTAFKSTLADDNDCGSPPHKAARTSSTPDVSTSRKGKGRQVEKSDQPTRLYVHNLHAPLVPVSSYLAEEVDAVLKYILPSGVRKQPPITYREALSSVSFLASDPVLSGELLKRTEQALTTCAASISHALLDPILLSKTMVQWLTEYIDKWHWYLRRLELLCSVLVGMDKGILRQQHATSLFDVGKDAWKNGPLTKGPILTQLRKCVREWITAERNADTAIDRGLIKLLIESMLAVGSYKSMFEDTIASITGSYYGDEAKDWREKKSPVEFLEHAEMRILQEEERCKAVIPLPSLQNIVSAAEQALWGSPEQGAWIMDEALPELLGEAKNTDARPSPEKLIRLHRLFTRTSSLDNFYNSLREHAFNVTRTMINLPPDKEGEMITDLLNLKLLLEEVARSLGDRQVNQVIDSVFTRAFAERPRKGAEMMAKYIDKAMRAKNQDEEQAVELNLVLDMYRYTSDKDVFRTYYYRGLAKRLLLSRSASDDQEKKVIELLKKEYDPEFEKGEEMFKDLGLSREVTADFHETTGIRSLTVFVLQSSSWPIARRKEGEQEVPLPLELQSQLSEFASFYKKKQERHVLDWHHGLGTAVLTGRYPNGVKELSMGMHQALVLLLFAYDDGLDFRQIRKSTEIGKSDLKRTLQSLACGKKRLLLKKPPGKDVDVDDVFFFNTNFEDSRRNIHIPSLAHQDTAEENKVVDAGIVDDRKYTLDAAIVRTMKATKKMKLDPLVNKVIEMVKGHFHPNVKMIKERIDNLLEQEYLSRDESDPKLYHYVA